ncbi:MAG: FAD-binding protein [Clostridiales bacterium]|jgi:electron transfer flavoprotein alpha subunit|nr:FAD-binding protein [Clostridiales bacterium]
MRRIVFVLSGVSRKERRIEEKTFKFAGLKREEIADSLRAFAAPLIKNGAKTEVYYLDGVDDETERSSLKEGEFFVLRRGEDAAFEELSEDLRRKDDGQTVFLTESAPCANRVFARLAYRFGVECVMNADGVIEENGEFYVVKKICGSNIDMKIPLGFAKVITVAPQPDKNVGIALVGGLGLKNGRNFERLKVLAGKIGANAWLTRAAALEFGGAEYIVGQSGRVIAPDICVILGASGASAFMYGVERSKKLVAVNNDSDAPIFKKADFGLLADAEVILTELEALWK